MASSLRWKPCSEHPDMVKAVLAKKVKPSGSGRKFVQPPIPTGRGKPGPKPGPRLQKGEDDVLAPAHQRVLDMLPTATATDIGESSVVSQEFEEYLRRRQSPNTAMKYRRSFTCLFNLHNRSFSAMASDEFVSVVGHMKKNLTGSYSATMKMFRLFWSERQGKAPASETRSSEIAPAEDRTPPKTATSFERHLEKQFGPQSSPQYRRALSMLLSSDGKSLDALASEESADTLRRQPRSKLHLGTSAKKFKTFFAKRGRPPGAPGTTRGRPPGKLPLEDLAPGKKPRSTEPATEREDTWITSGRPAKRGEASEESISAFMDYVRSSKAPSTVLQYGTAIRALVHEHKKSLEDMACQEYLDSVRELNWNPKYAATIGLLCKFRGVELTMSGHAWRRTKLEPAAVQEADTQAPAQHGRREFEQREQANAKARKLLATAQAKRLPVSDGDVLEVLRLFPFEQNSSRTHVLPKGAGWVHSTTIGIVPSGRNVVANVAGAEDVLMLLCQWLDHQLGVALGAEAFPVTSITINKDFAAARHRDNDNLGPSAIRALGDCRGGQLRYWPNAPAGADLDGLHDKDSQLLDPRHKVVFFDGNFPHEVTPFDGERYSVIFFTSSLYKQVAINGRAAEARRLGLRWPTAQLLATAKAKLAAP